MQKIEFVPRTTASARFVAGQERGGVRRRCSPRVCRLERQGRGQERGVRGLVQAPRPRRRALVGRAPRLEGVGARPPMLGAPGPIKALQAQSMGTLGGGRVAGV